MVSENSDDKAWVRVELSAVFEDVLQFCSTPENLYRLNPQLDIDYWFWKPQAESTQTGTIRWFNHSNGQWLQSDLLLERSTVGWVCHWKTGIKIRTRVEIGPGESGVTIQITDEYADIDAEQKQNRLNEVDKSLAAWGQGIRDYFDSLSRYRWIPGWQWYRSHLWLRLKPRSRRILFLLFWITVAELLLFLFVWMIFLLEGSR